MPQVKMLQCDTCKQKFAHAHEGLSEAQLKVWAKAQQEEHRRDKVEQGKGRKPACRGKLVDFVAAPTKDEEATPVPAPEEAAPPARKSRSA